MADVMELIKQHEADMIGIRRHIHANPELSNEENRTTALIREKLEEYGIEIMEIGLKTGVVGFLKGGRPGKTVAIREDIDALPMSEKRVFRMPPLWTASAIPADTISIPQSSCFVPGSFRSSGIS